MIYRLKMGLSAISDLQWIRENPLANVSNWRQNG